MKNIIFRICLLLLVVGACSLEGYAQKKSKKGDVPCTVTGKVTDGNDEPLVGVNIQVDGNNRKNAITNIDGEFTIESPNDRAALVFSYMGMETRKVELKGRTELTVVLQEDAIALDEVVAIGYGTARRSDLTGTVASITAEEIQDMPGTNLVEVLQGRVPGLVISSASGDVEASVQVRVRGGVSITQDNSPLYIVDGFQMDDALSMLDPLEIERVDVLKDASATAIYGSRGANGVIIIKTKSGKKNQNTISYEMNYNWKKVAGGVELLSPIDYLKFDFQRQPNAYEREKWVSIYGPITDIYTNYGSAEGVNWEEEMLGRGTSSHKHSINFNGGGDRVQYNLSYIYSSENGVVSNTGKDKHSIRFSLNHALTDRISINANASYFTENTRGNGAYAENGNQWFNLFKYKPVVGIYEDEEDSEFFVDPNDPDAENDESNPHTALSSIKRGSTKMNASMNAGLNFKIIDGLSYALRLGYTKGRTERDSFYGANSSQAKQNGGAFGSMDRAETQSFIGNHTLTYDKKLKKSRITALIGQEIKTFDYNRLVYGAHGFPEVNFGLDHMEMGTRPDKFKSNKYGNNGVSFFTRANYEYSRYLFTFTMRADGSSKFSKENRWGYFPAGAFAWRLGEEPFIKKLNIFHNLKLRFSYGATGNNAIEDYLFWSIMKGSWMPVNNETTNSYVPSIGNKKLKWETNKTANIGLDFSFFKGRLAFTVDLYQTDTEDLLMNDILQPSSGYVEGTRNIGATRSRGCEVNVNAHIIKSKSFNWNATLNMSFDETVVKRLAGSDQWLKNSNTNRSTLSYEDFAIEVGKRLGTYYGFVYDGLYQADDFNFTNGEWVLKDGVVGCDLYEDGPQPGLVKYKNLNPADDNIVDIGDRTHIGNAYPACNGGLTNTFRYKDLSLSLLCVFKIGGKIYNGNLFNYLYPGKRGYNTTKYIFDRMYSYIDGDGTDLLETGNSEKLMAMNKGKYYPRAGLIPFSSMCLEDASFLRLANINVTYNLPRKWLRKIWVKSAQLSFSAQNLGTWTKYSGYDPEVSMNRNNGLTPGIDKGSVPRNHSYSLGLKVQF